MGLPSEHRSDQSGGKPRERHRARWVISVCVGIAIIFAAGFYWRLPLAGAMLRVALDQAGINDATLTVSAFSTSRIRLIDVRLGSALEIESVEAAVDLSRLPASPFTRFVFDGVRSDRTVTDSTFRQVLGNRRASETPATIRTLLDGMAGLPAIAITDLSLRYAAAGPVLAVTGSADAGSEDGGVYAVNFAIRFSGELKEETRVVEVDGTARIAADATTLEVRAKTSDGAVGGILTGRADISSDHAVVSGGVRLELRDLGRLALISPVMEGASGRVVGTARTNKPVAIGLDTPVDLSGVAAALQRGSPGAFKLEATIEDGSHVAGLQGINGTISALVGSVPDASDELRMEGMLSLQARQIMAGPVTLKEARLSGDFRLTRREGTLTVVLPKATRIGVAEIISKDQAISLSPLAMSLSSGPTPVLRVGRGSTNLAESELKLDVDAARGRWVGKQVRDFDFAPFNLRLVGAADHRWVMAGEIRVPKLSVTEKNKVGVVDDLMIMVSQSGTSITGNVRGRVSARDGDKPLFHPILVESGVSLCCDILTFDSKAMLPAGNVASMKGQYNYVLGKGTTILDLPAFHMTPGGGEFRALAPSFFGFVIRSGIVRANADLSWDKEGFDGTAAVGIKDMDLIDGTSGATIQGLSADIRLERLVPPLTPPEQAIGVKQIAAGVTFDNLALRFALVKGVAPDIPALQIGSFQTLFAGGRLSISPAVIDAAAKSSQAEIAVENVNLAALLATIGLDGVSGTGRLSGVIPVKMAGKAVGIAGGRLAASGPGILRVRSDTVKKALAQGGAEVALLLSALEDFRYESLTVEIEKEASGEGRIVLRTRGQNPAVSAGQPFVVNLNLSGNVNRLAAVAAQAFQLPGDLFRTILPK